MEDKELVGNIFISLFILAVSDYLFPETSFVAKSFITAAIVALLNHFSREK